MEVLHITKHNLEDAVGLRARKREQIQVVHVGCDLGIRNNRRHPDE